MKNKKYIYSALLMVLTLFLGLNYLNHKKSSRLTSLSIPATYTLIADQIVRGQKIGTLAVSVRNKDVRLEATTDTDVRTTLQKDGFLYLLSPLEKVMPSVQAHDDWRFESTSYWTYLRTETFENKRVDVYSLPVFRKGKVFYTEISYDPKLKFPVRSKNQDGNGWSLKSLDLSEPPQVDFDPPAALITKRQQPPPTFCEATESANCSYGWFCGDPCPGGNCC